MSCTVCGTDSPASDGRCRHCGTPLAGGAPTEPAKAWGGAATVEVGAIDGEAAGGTDAPEQPLIPGVVGLDARVTMAPVDIPPSEDGPLEPDQSFGLRYRIVRLLGVGGMGAVYEAWDSELAITVALKVVRPEVAADPAAARQMEQRFKRELLLARQVTHKNVVRIHDLGEIHGIKYITMSFIEGEDLATILRREQRLPVARTLRIMRTVLSGLVAAHQAGVVHRDLKPANIMIRADDEALIMDFGIARSAGRPEAGGPPGGDTSGTALSRESPVMAGGTQVGKVVGTLEYMAPEQAKGVSVDQRADIYSFGLICYDMLAGRPPAATGTDALADLMSRMKQPPPAPRSLNPAVPEALDRIVAKCLQPDADARYRTSVELAGELARLDAGGKLLPVLRRVTSRLVAAVAGLVLVLLAGTWYLARTAAAPKAHEPVSVLVADFENRTGDAVFDGTVEQALTLAVEGASFITAYPRADAQAQVNHIRPGARLDEQMARLVSKRAGINIVLAGAIERTGDGYTISARAFDPTTDPAHSEPLATASVSAPARDQVLGAVGALAAKLRGSLGDTTPESVQIAAADTFTASSLEVIKTYSVAQDFQSSGRKAEALAAYRRAIEQDPKFGLGYSGAAIMAFELGRQEEAQALWNKALTLRDRMTDRERYRTDGAYYLGVVRNFEKAIETYRALVDHYPSDRSGRANLALAYFWALNFPKAREEGRRAVALNPTNLLHRSNSALYAMYAGDFETAAKETAEVIRQEPAFYVAYVPLAMAALARGDTAAARAEYTRMAAASPAGASLAAMGLGDIALYEGRYDQAVAALEAGIAADRRSGNTAGVAAKEIALGEAHEARARRAQAVAAVTDALKLVKGRVIAVPAAELLLRTGQAVTAKALADGLSQQLQKQDRAYGTILSGEIARKDRRMVDAVEAFLAAQKLADFWLGRFRLGVAYVEAEHYAEGLAELEACVKRRGEAVAISLDETPSFRYLATLPYWLGRAQQGVGMAAAATGNLQAFLNLRGHLTTDPLVVDARKRLAPR